jgi:hypothetical protein
MAPVSSCAAPIISSDQWSGSAKKYCTTIDGTSLCWLWVSSCTGGCSKVPMDENGMTTDKPSWCPCGARESTQAEWDSAIGETVLDDFHGKCSASIFDPRFNHCDRTIPADQREGV